MNLSDKFNLDSLNALMSASRTVDNSSVMMKDAGVLLTRHLTMVNPRILEKKYPDLVFDQLGISIDNTGGYATSIQTLRLKAQGKFDERGSGRGKISIEMEDTLIKVFDRDALIEWDYFKMKEAELGNYNIVDRTMAASLLVYNQEIDTSVVTGLDGFNDQGLTNNTIYETVVGQVYAGLTAQQKYDLIADNITQQANTVNNTTEYKANICILPTTVYNIAQNTILNTFTNGTVLRVLMANFPDIKFLHSPKAGGSMVLLNNSIESVVFRLPVPLLYSPVFQNKFDFSTSAVYRIAGIDILEPDSGLIVTGLIAA